MDHIAIMKKSWGLLPKIASGEKTIESRWYAMKCRPWGAIAAGDTVYFKDSGAPVRLAAEVRKVRHYADLTPADVKKILKTHGAADGIASRDIPEFYKRFKDKRYAMLIFLKKARPVRPFAIDKKGFGAMAAWISVPKIATIKK